MRMLQMPPAIRAHLEDVVRQVWPDPEPVIAQIPSELPEGRVTSLARGGPFGRMLDGRLDEIDGRVMLEVLENSRMDGESYYRVTDAGRVHHIQPAPKPSYSWSEGASQEEKDAVVEAYQAHNRVAYGLLERRGFIRPPRS